MTKQPLTPYLSAITTRDEARHGANVTVPIYRVWHRQSTLDVGSIYGKCRSITYGVTVQAGFDSRIAIRRRSTDQQLPLIGLWAATALALQE